MLNTLALYQNSADRPAGIAGNFLSPLLAAAQQRRNALAPQQQPANQLMTAREGGSDIGLRLMSDLMRDFGLTAEQAAGVVGNLAHESGGFESLQEVSPLVPGSRGGYGYAQWTGPRRRAFEAWAQSQGIDPASYDANYGFLRHELTATPEGRVLGPLRSAATTDEATGIFSDQFLRPGIPHMGNRLALARGYAG